MIKGVSPRVLLVIDTILFGLLATLIFTALMANIAPRGMGFLRSGFRLLHTTAGIAMCLTLAVHLFLHLPWIWSQVKRLLVSQG